MEAKWRPDVLSLLFPIAPANFELLGLLEDHKRRRRNVRGLLKAEHLAQHMLESLRAEVLLVVDCIPVVDMLVELSWPPAAAQSLSLACRDPRLGYQPHTPHSEGIVSEWRGPET